MQAIRIVLYELEELPSDVERELMDLVSTFKELQGVNDASFIKAPEGEHPEGINYQLTVQCSDVPCLYYFMPSPKHKEFLEKIEQYKKNEIVKRKL